MNFWGGEAGLGRMGDGGRGSESRIDGAGVRASALPGIGQVRLYLICLIGMAEVQTRVPTEPVAGTARSSGVDKDALITRLDALLEQYLYTLDSYEKLMQQLSKQLSSVCRKNPCH